MMSEPDPTEVIPTMSPPARPIKSVGPFRSWKRTGPRTSVTRADARFPRPCR